MNDTNTEVLKSNCQETNLKLSIITICYNEKNIEDTCRSVINQVWQDFEWIVVDGGSTDETLEILEKYKKRINIFMSEKDNGRYDAMNKGILKASGEYLLFLNGGDFLVDNNVLKKIFQYTSIPSCKWSDLTFDSDINYGEVLLKETGMMPWPGWAVGPQCFNLLFFLRYSLPHQATFIKRNLFMKYGLYDTSFQSAGDKEWFMRVLLLHKASYSYIPMPVSVYNFEGLSSQADSVVTEESRCAYRKIAELLLQNKGKADTIETALLRNNFTKLQDVLGLNYYSSIVKIYIYRLLVKIYSSKQLVKKINKYEQYIKRAQYCRYLIFKEISYRHNF